jgi:DNA-binding transcriptional ArsR family regulator
MNSGAAKRHEVKAGWWSTGGVAELASQANTPEAVLVRVNFTPDDVARTRFTLDQAPLSDTVLAFIELRRAAAVGWGSRRVSPWLREARRSFPATARPLLDVLGARPPWPDLFDYFTADLEEGLDGVRATPRAALRAELSGCWGERRVGRPPLWLRNLADGDREELELVIRALRDLHDAVVAPRWDSALVAFHADLARRIPVLVAGGHEALLGTLHPKLRWRDDGLDRVGFDVELGLGGKGLLIRPSAFWTGEPVFSLDPEGSRSNVLVYAAQRNGHPAAEENPAEPAVRDSLAALLGPTRAAVLRALRGPRSTAELAAAVRISPASASEHAKVLRDAYLIETRREGRSVRHSLTAFGRTILGHLPAANGEPGEPREPRARAG